MAGAPLPPGKIPVDLLTRLLATSEAAPDDVLLGPSVGEDACALAVAGGALVAATDPITLTSGDLGRYAVMVNANDVAVTGVRPRWFLATVLLPAGATDALVEEVFTTMRAALAEIGATLVGGHTEVTTAVTQPVVVGQMLGYASDGRFVTTGGARAGDVIVQVGAVPVEGAAVLAVEAAERLGSVPADQVAAAAGAVHQPGISVVEAALAAAELGATAMHDPTEGGLASALHEMATAAGASIRVDRAAVRWFDPGLAVCRALGADPWATLASGTLLAAFPAERVAAATEALSALPQPVAAIGVVEAGTGVRDEAGDPLDWPARDELARILGP